MKNIKVVFCVFFTFVMLSLSGCKDDDNGSLGGMYTDSIKTGKSIELVYNDSDYDVFLVSKSKDHKIFMGKFHKDGGHLIRNEDQKDMFKIENNILIDQYTGRNLAYSKNAN